MSDAEVPIIDIEAPYVEENKFQKSRNFCFTVFNNLDIDNIFDILSSHKAKYIICGEEIAPKTGKKHLQCFVHFPTDRSWNAVYKYMKGLDFRLFICKGNASQNITYCSKGGTFREFGERPHQGKRNDLGSITDAIKDGKSTKEIIETFGDKSLRITNHIDKVRGILKSTKRNWVMDVRIYWGPSESGKSRAVWDEFGDDVYPKMVGKWWDQYNCETCVLIDDFDPTNVFDITFDFYLKLMDRYPMLIEYKGGSCYFCSKTIVFTSNFNPANWFLEKSNRNAFFRRVTTIKYFGEAEVEVGKGNSIPSPLLEEESTRLPTWYGIK